MTEKRHRWGYERPAVCRDCGALKRNARGISGGFIFALEYSADGKVWRRGSPPPCAPRTGAEQS